MGRYRRDKLRCYKCLKVDGHKRMIYEGTMHDPGITWRNIEVLGPSKPGGEYPKCRCKKCGYTYIARSIAGYHALEWWKTDQAKKATLNGSSQSP